MTAVVKSPLSGSVAQLMPSSFLELGMDSLSLSLRNLLLIITLLVMKKENL